MNENHLKFVPIGKDPAVTAQNFLYDHIMPQLPKKWMSHLVGKMAHLQIPQKVNRQLVKNFAKAYKIDLSEIEKPLEDYKTLGEFFSRKLKEGARPIAGEIVHPCDGQLIESGKIHKELLIQAKGKSYSLSEFLPETHGLKILKRAHFSLITWLHTIITVFIHR